MRGSLAGHLAVGRCLYLYTRSSLFRCQSSAPTVDRLAHLSFGRERSLPSGEVLSLSSGELHWPCPSRFVRSWHRHVMSDRFLHCVGPRLRRASFHLRLFVEGTAIRMIVNNLAVEVLVVHLELPSGLRNRVFACCQCSPSHAVILFLRRLFLCTQCLLLTRDYTC